MRSPSTATAPSCAPTKPVARNTRGEALRERAVGGGERHGAVSSRVTRKVPVPLALPPVIVLPFSYFVLKEKIGWQAIAGTVLAIVGVAVLFLV